MGTINSDGQPSGAGAANNSAKFNKISSNSTGQGASSSSSRERRLDAEIVMRSLRMLQLFCEGHNLEMQNYIRIQKNSRNSHDMVSLVVDLLYTYIFEVDSIESNFENIIKCLDTLIEFVQGPCQ